MPQRKPTQDDYWGASDKEMVALRGSFEYISGLCCGHTKPGNTVSTIRHNTPVPVATYSGGMVYGYQHNAVVYSAQSIPTDTANNWYTSITQSTTGN